MTGPRSMALCLERVDAASMQQRFLQCVALPGNRPGLALDEGGAVRWCDAEARATCELWISADEVLIALRPAGAAPVRLERAGRGLELPEGKPVELIDEDELIVGGVRQRLHVHGFAMAEAAPAWLAPAPQLSRSGPRGARAGSTAAALAFGAAVGLGGAGAADAGKAQPKPPVVVRPRPPAPMPHPKPPKKPEKPKKPDDPKKPKKPKKPADKS